jgi:hypothetical protein
MAVFWFVAPCILAKFISVLEVLTASIIRVIAFMMETLVNSYQPTRRYKPEDSYQKLYLTVFEIRVLKI